MKTLVVLSMYSCIECSIAQRRRSCLLSFGDESGVSTIQSIRVKVQRRSSASSPPFASMRAPTTLVEDPLDRLGSDDC